MQHPPAPGCTVWFMWHTAPCRPAGLPGLAGLLPVTLAYRLHVVFRALCSCSLSASPCMCGTEGSLWCSAALSPTFCLEGSPVCHQPLRHPLHPALLSAPRQCPSWVLNLQLDGELSGSSPSRTNHWVLAWDREAASRAPSASLQPHLSASFLEGLSPDFADQLP